MGLGHNRTPTPPFHSAPAWLALFTGICLNNIRYAVITQLYSFSNVHSKPLMQLSLASSSWLIPQLIRCYQFVSFTNPDDSYNNNVGPVLQVSPPCRVRTDHNQPHWFHARHERLPLAGLQPCTSRRMSRSALPSQSYRTSSRCLLSSGWPLLGAMWSAIYPWNVPIMAGVFSCVNELHSLGVSLETVWSVYVCICYTNLIILQVY